MEKLCNALLSRFHTAMFLRRKLKTSTKEYVIFLILLKMIINVNIFSIVIFRKKYLNQLFQ